MAVQGCATTWCNLPFCTSSPRSAREVDFFARLYTIEYLYIYIYISTTLYNIYMIICKYIKSIHYIYIHSIHDIYTRTFQKNNSKFCYLYILSVIVIVLYIYIYLSLFIAYTDFDIGFIIGECD